MRKACPANRWLRAGHSICPWEEGEREREREGRIVGQQWPAMDSICMFMVPLVWPKSAVAMATPKRWVMGEGGGEGGGEGELVRKREGRVREEEGRREGGRERGGERESRKGEERGRGGGGGGGRIGREGGGREGRIC